MKQPACTYSDCAYSRVGLCTRIVCVLAVVLNSSLFRKAFASSSTAEAEARTRVVVGADPTRNVSANLPHIIFIVADDLGYEDLGFKNGNKTHTPVLDGLIRDGVHMTSYYTFKLCSPTRASLMSGRYPWGIG